jgi:photosystem II stability/assembly factor-like uncharacterized protein
MISRRLVWFAALPVLALVIGVAVAVASSPASLNPDRHLSTGVVRPTPSPLDSTPPPTVTAAGLLGDSAHLVASGTNNLIALGTKSGMASTDGGKTWFAIGPPASGLGLAVDPANPRHAITGGSGVQVSNDGGATWKPSQTPPPGKGPYQPVAISPFDGTVWFFIHQNQLLRTRDGSLTWNDLGGLPLLNNAVLVSGEVYGQFFLASGNRVFQLVDNGQKINELPPLSQGSVTDLAVADGNRPILLARAGTSIYLFNGTTWVTAGGSLAGPIAAGSNGTLLVGNGGARLGSPGLVSSSTNGGTKWTQAVGLPYDQSVEAIAGQLGSSIFFAYCYGGDIYASSDRGRVWILLTRGLRSKSG